MSSYVLFLLLGLGSGAVYGILALGLVLKHRAAGVVDFGHGAVAMFIAYVYLALTDTGSLQFPWVVLPHEIDLGGPLATAPAIVVSLIYAAILGAIKDGKAHPNFLAHEYTCDGKQLPGNAAVCNAYQKMKQVKGGKIITVDDQWVTGAEYYTPPPAP